MRNTRDPENLSAALLLHSALPLYPAAVFGNSGVDAGFFPASAAVAPAHHASQEDPPPGAGDRQRTTGVTLRGSERKVRAAPAQKSAGIRSAGDPTQQVFSVASSVLTRGLGDTVGVRLERRQVKKS